MKKPKVLNVRLTEDKQPEFDFIGEWTGNDIALVQRLIRRQYALKQRSVRRAVIATKEE